MRSSQTQSRIYILTCELRMQVLDLLVKCKTQSHRDHMDMDQPEARIVLRTAHVRPELTCALRTACDLVLGVRKCYLFLGTGVYRLQKL